MFDVLRDEGDKLLVKNDMGVGMGCVHMTSYVKLVFCSKQDFHMTLEDSYLS